MHRLVACILLGGVALAGCSTTYEERIASVRAAWTAGDLGRAAGLLAKLRRSDPGNSHLYLLEEGMVALAAGRPRAALRAWRRARDRLDALLADDPAAWFGAMLTDDRMLPYRGDDYEHVLVRAMLALADLAAGGGDAAAFANQVLEKQLEIIDRFAGEYPGGLNPKRRYKLVAFGSYLRGILSEENPLELDVARREFERVVRLAPQFPYGREALRRARRGRHSRRGNGVIHVLALVGRGPFKVEVEERVTAQALALAQFFWNLHRRRANLPQLVSIKIPAVAWPRDNPDDLVVTVDGREAGHTATVTDVVETALREYEAMKDWLLARAIVRRAFKILLTESAKAVARPRHENAAVLTDLAFDLVGLAWSAAERADTRCWSLLPRAFQALRIEVPAGEHRLLVRARHGSRVTGRPQTVRVRVEDGRNTYVLVFAPTPAGGPPPLVTVPAAGAVPVGAPAALSGRRGGAAEPWP